MTVIGLPLSGLADADADQAVRDLLDHRTGPPRLERVLVVDDTAALVGHEPLYQRIVSSNRVHALLCVAVGPRVGGDGKLDFVRKYDLETTAARSLFWMGVVSLPSPR